MNKRMREIMSCIEDKTAKVKSYMEGENKDIEKANALLDEIDALRKEYETEERVYNLTKNENAPTEKEVEDSKTKDYTKSFAEAARNGFKVNKSMNEGTVVEGGYVVPEQIETQINNYKTAKSSLLDLVRIRKVNTNKGAYTFKDRATQTGFSKVTEGSNIGAKATPQFSRVTWEIGKYAGYFPVTNEVLEDTDANLVGTLVEWIGDESRVTSNKLILAKIRTKSAVALSGIDGMKKALNVTLGSAFKATSVIVTNDDGLNYLDTLKDANGRYLLAPNPSDTMQLRLQIGATFVPVKVYPNEDINTLETYALTTDTAVDKTKVYYTKSNELYTKVTSPSTASISTYYEKTFQYPFILGDLKEGIEYFDRKLLTIKVSDTAQVGDLNAYEQDLTLYRAIEREDVNIRDTKAFVNGYIPVVETK